MKKNQKTWKVIDILKTTTDYFKDKQIENPRLNAEQLLAHVLDLSRVQLYVQFERPLSSTEVSLFRELIRRRAANEPLQYILGETEFMGLNFKVTPATLIPRPETELLVEHIIETVKNSKNENISIIDIGTGSGCIAISLAHYLTDCKIIATDISQEALNLAKNNATANKTNNVNFLKHDILMASKFPVDSIDIIVSNPPYISVAEMNDLPNEIKNFEPEVALTDNKNGILFYDKILSLIDKDLKCKFVIMEMNANLKDQIINIATKYGFTDLEIITDLNDLPRILKIRV
ncbi:MAG: peptide chain release factor N(5)-glutamine methyltransferase [Calditrichia bacterium]|nr:peptide chain release factor N(5)-glutamine methyltransferase [Calditrichia bacterium]